MKLRTARLLARATSFLLAAVTARAETVTLEPFKDNTLYEDDDGARSNGAGAHLFVGRAAGSDLGRTRRALLAFDVSGGLPAGATISSARLILHMSRTVSGEQMLALHRVLADWGEGASAALGEEGMGAAAAPGDATWLHRFFDGTFWATPGGDFAATASATRSVGGIASYVWGSASPMVADVQGWLDSPQTNFGWIVIGNESTSPTSKRFDSRENGASVRPKLEIQFEAGGVETETPTATPTESPTASATATSAADTETPTPSATPTRTGAATATPTPTATPSPGVTDTPTASPSETPTDTPTVTPTSVPSCAGDCDRNGVVSVDELIRGVAIALGRDTLEVCELLDAAADGVAIDDLVRAVRSSIEGCARGIGAAPSPTSQMQHLLAFG